MHNQSQNVHSLPSTVALLCAFCIEWQKYVKQQLEKSSKQLKIQNRIIGEYG